MAFKPIKKITLVKLNRILKNKSIKTKFIIKKMLHEGFVVVFAINQVLEIFFSKNISSELKVNLKWSLINC